MTHKKQRANKESMRSARKIVRDMTPEQCKWFLLHRVFADNFPDVNVRKQDRWIAAMGQESMFDQLKLETRDKHMNTHTKGPWKVADGIKIVGITVWRNDGTDDNTGYARICRNVRSNEDARLIAAAPALLSALELALKCADDHGGEYVSEARAAIQLAKGGA